MGVVRYNGIGMVTEDEFNTGLAGKQDTPATEGAAGQILGLDNELKPIWVDAGEAGTYEASITNPGSETNAPQTKAVREYVQAGDFTARLADNLSSWESRGTLSVGDSFSDIVQTAAGDVSIDSSKGCILESIVPTEDFYASDLVNTGKNLLRFATQVGDAWYFLVPKLEFGTYGTADKPNGVLFLNSSGTNLTPTVYFKPVASGVPTSATDGTACTYTDSNGHRFYTTPGIGYMIVSGITRASTCARIAWSTGYDEYVAVDAAGDAGATIALAATIAEIHSYNKMLVIGGSADRIDRYSASQVQWTRACDRVQPEWTTTEDTETGDGYIHTATISGMKNGGVVRCAGISLSVDGTTVSYSDDNEEATSEYVYYELATPATGLKSLTTGVAIEDFGLTMLKAATGSAVITMQYAQGYPDSVADLVNGGVERKIEPVRAETLDNTSRIIALESNAFGKDLSYVDPLTGGQLVPRNTANCYVIRAAGNYRIPLVYGNGIKNSAVNAAAYTRKGSTYTADFVNHLGNALTSPFIEENTGCAAGSVGLLWQTANGLVSSPAIFEGPDCRYLSFTAGSIPTTNGLAVVYVKDADGAIMWSWMLWFTTDNLSPLTFKNYTNVEYYLMPENLGTIWNADRTRSVSPFYQWGRKDPMCPANAYNGSSNLALYDISGSAYAGYGAYGVADDSDAGGSVRSVANAIQKPEKLFLEYDATKYNWNNLDWFNNFWNANEVGSNTLADNQATAIKTIYDPCPAGFMLPMGRAYTGFTTTGSNTTDATQFNVIGTFDAGWTFKKNSADAEGNFFAASGRRLRTSGALYDVGSGGYCWVGAPYSQTYARLLLFYSGDVYPLNYNYRASGFAVRPSRELN